MNKLVKYAKIYVGRSKIERGDKMTSISEGENVAKISLSKW